METVIREGTLRLLTSEASCDVILSCQGHRLMAHKIILSIASPMLRDLLLQHASEPSVLIFPDIHSNTMSLILDYIYTGSVVVYSNTIDDFIAAAALLRLDIDVNCLQKYAKKEEKVFSKRNQRQLPSLVPIGKMQEQRKLIRCVIPSPWSPREKPLLSDPRNHCAERLVDFHHTKIDGNDANNNSQKKSKTETVTTRPEIELDLSTSNKTITEKLIAPHSSNVLIKEEIPNESTPEKSEENKKQKLFKCQDCGKTFSQLRNFKYHRSVHEGTKEFAAKCPECGKIFNDRGYLSSHMKIHRDRKEYACPHCPKRFNQRVAYNMHLRIHTGIKPHECPTCGKSFSRKMLLKQHQRVHTGERPYSCPECGKTFADRSNMSLHARLHTGVKPYSCTICTKSFTKKHHLKTHMNFHTGLKPYSCQKCGLAFSQSSNMRTHFKKCVLKTDGHSTSSENVEVDSN